MTIGVVKSQGTKLYFLGPNSTSEILAVACPQSIEGLGGAANQIDKTCLDSIEMEYERGMQNPGQITVPINFIPRSASHQALLDLRQSGDTVGWMIVAPGSPAPNGIDADGYLTATGPSNIAFLGYVADLTVNIATNDIWRATITIQRSGELRYQLPVADLA
jgi:hypothetical protein